LTIYGAYYEVIETLRRRKMHARVISFTIQPGKTDEAIKFFQDYLPKMER
jgi:ERCC4-related helicase